MMYYYDAENNGQAGVPSAPSTPSGQGRGETTQPCVAACLFTFTASTFAKDLGVQGSLHKMLILTVKQLLFNSSIS